MQKKEKKSEETHKKLMTVNDLNIKNLWEKHDS